MHTAPGVENITHEVYKGFSRIICPMRDPAKPMIMMEKGKSNTCRRVLCWH